MPEDDGEHGNREVADGVRYQKNLNDVPERQVYEIAMLAVRAVSVYTKGVEERPHRVAPGIPQRRSNSRHVFISEQLAANISAEGLRGDKHLKCNIAVIAGRVNT